MKRIKGLSSGPKISSTRRPALESTLMEGGKKTGTMRGVTAGRSPGKQVVLKNSANTGATKSKARAPSAAAFDGGVAALAGYVNQMLGSVADFARCISGQTSDSDGFKTLICFETEVHGQDSSAISQTASKQATRVLKQYKYSANPDKYPIRRDELQAIIKTLKASEKKARKTQDIPTELVLCTNRPFSPAVMASSAYKSIRHETYSASEATDQLRSYALRFGVYDPKEFDDGVRRVTNQLFHIATSPSHRLTQLDFEEHLIGHTAPRSIMVTEAAAARLKELDDLGTNILKLTSKTLAQREAIKDAADWKNDAIIVFVGEGGCGKTTALWQILREAAHTQPPQKLAAMMIPQAHSLQSFGDIVERWRGISANADGVSDDKAMERVVRANSGAVPPIVYLGLDGIDETHLTATWNSIAARVLSFFWTLHMRARQEGVAPSAKLFVSCRNESELKRLLPDPTGTGLADLTPRYVYFREFTNTELTDLVQRDSNVDQKAAELISLSLMKSSEAIESKYGPPAISVPTSSILMERLELLKHPILWRSFASLDANAQNGVIAGSIEALDNLGRGFLCWFCDRIVHRINVETVQVPTALRSVAQHCQDSSATYLHETWVRCVRDSVGFTETDAISLYQESVSSGIVQNIPAAGGPVAPRRSWRWKHLFFAEFLKRPSGQ